GAKLDRVSTAPAADHEAIDYLARRVEALAAMFEARDLMPPPAPDRAAIDDLAHRIEALAAMLEARDAAPPPARAADHEAIDYLAHRIESLAATLEAREMAPPPAPDTTRIESLIRGLTDRLETMGTAPAGHF